MAQAQAAKDIKDMMSGAGLGELPPDPGPEMVKIKFLILDDTFMDPKTKKRQPLQFSYGDNRYELHHGASYTLPREVVNHLNTNCGYPTYEYRDVKDDLGQIIGQQSVQVGIDPRFECIER